MNGIGSPETPPDIEQLKAAKDVEGLSAALYYRNDEQVCKAAAKALGGLGTSRAVELLIWALREYDGEEGFLVSIVEALEMIEGGVDAAVDTLLKLLTREEPVIIDGTEEGCRSRWLDSHLYMAQAFRALGSPAVRAALSAAKQGVEIAHLEDILGTASGEDVDLLLEEFKESELEEFKESEGRVSKAILATAFGLIGDKRAIELILPLLKASEDGVRWRAAKALERLGWTPKGEAEQALWHVARHEWKLAAALGQAALDALERALHTPYHIQYHYDYGRVMSMVDVPREQPRNSAIEALILIGEPATQILLDALEILSCVWREIETYLASESQDKIIAGLVSIGEPAVEALLLAAEWRQKYDPRREGAIDALCSIISAGKIKDDVREKRVIESLARALLKEVSLDLENKLDSDGVYSVVSDTLCSLGASKVLPFLIPSFRDPSLITRRAAAEILTEWEVSEQEFMQALEGFRPDERVEYTKALEEVLLVKLRDEERSFRYAAIPILEWIGWKPKTSYEIATYLIGSADTRLKKLCPVDYGVVETLLDLLRKDKYLYTKIISALASASDEQAIARIMNASKDDNETVRLAATRALEMIREEAESEQS